MLPSNPTRLLQLMLLELRVQTDLQLMSMKGGGNVVPVEKQLKKDREPSASDLEDAKYEQERREAHERIERDRAHERENIAAQNSAVGYAYRANVGQNTDPDALMPERAPTQE